MTTYNIAVIPGDGIGHEVVAQGLRVLQELEKKKKVKFQFTEFSWGSEHYLSTGRMMPSDGLDRLLPFDAIYFGAVGHPDIQDHITLNGLLLPMRRAFDQYVCLRPSVLYGGVASPLAGKSPGDIDMLVIRENTEGEYANIGGFQYQNSPQETAVQSSIFTRYGCERVIRYAFDLAVSRKRKHVTSITKSNAQGYGMVLWDKVFLSVAEEYPGITTDSQLIDAACMNFVRKPEFFDVVVGSNLFGDILTDIGAIITGSMGLAASANLNPTRKYPSLFEPVHGSAPDIAGRGIANPLAAILSVAMMLDHLGEQELSSEVERGTLAVLNDHTALTPDLGGTASTEEVGSAVVEQLFH